MTLTMTTPDDDDGMICMYDNDNKSSYKAHASIGSICVCRIVVLNNHHV